MPKRRAKAKAGPTGLLVIHPEGGEGMTLRQLLGELVIDMVVSTVLMIPLLAQVYSGYRRVAFA